MAGELIEQFNDHEGRVSRFIEQYKNLPDLVALARSYLAQLQDVEDALFEIILERNLDSAVGVQLEVIGDIVQQPRTTSDDARFRTAIRARIAINLSDATTEDLIKVASLLLVDGETFFVRDEPPAQIRITVVDPLTSTDPDLLQQLLDEADAGGVRLLLSYTAEAETGGFVFSHETGAVVGKGFEYEGAGADAGKFTNSTE